jgi:hypothetical protein
LNIKCDLWLCACVFGARLTLRQPINLHNQEDFMRASRLRLVLKSFLITSSLILCWIPLSKSFLLRAQTNRPAAEHQSLLNMRFYERDAGFLVEEVQVVFPPSANPGGTLSINKASGEEVLSVPLRMVPFGNFPAFANFVPDGNTGGIRLNQAGDFVMTVKVGNEVVTRLPFSLRLEQGNDPFNPQQRFVRDGPWRDLGFISVPMDDSTQNINFNFWLSVRELPAGMSNPRVNVHILHGAQEIGVTRSPVVPSYIDWQFFSKELVTPSGLAPGSPHYLTMADLKKDGDYSVVLKANRQNIKSYRFQVKAGQIQRPDQSRLDYEPHANFISPRYIDTTAGTSSRYHMRDMFWVRKSAK